MRKWIADIITSNELHARWLNTLSFLENCGARKIAACEHPSLVREEVLKHAAEEFRHAHHLKRQIAKVSLLPLETYSHDFILGGVTTFHYLNALDLKTSQYLKANGLPKEAAYLLVTYAIELRAKELYHVYHEELRKVNSKVSVKSILLEEEEHLNEMIEGIKLLPSGFEHANKISNIEEILFNKWSDALQKETTGTKIK